MKRAVTWFQVDKAGLLGRAGCVEVILTPATVFVPAGITYQVTPLSGENSNIYEIVTVIAADFLT